MTLKLKVVNPLHFEDWDSLILSNQNYSFYHSKAWARVLSESYHYKPIYFALFNEKKIRALVPLMEINSFLTGRRGVSLPFSDYCEPIFSKDTDVDEVIDKIIEFGNQADWKHIEFRFENGHLKKECISQKYFGHVLDLQEDHQAIFSKFRGSTKRNTKKAIKMGVEVKICHSLDSVKKFYYLNCLTRKFHGLPPQPWYFFKKVFQHLISTKKGFVVLAFYKNKVIASAVYLLYGHKAIYKYGASDLRFRHLRPNNLVMWKAVEWSARNGFKSLDFGRTEPLNKGLLQFKSGWRGKEKIISYHKYDFAKNAFVKKNSGIKSSYGFIKLLPSSILKFVGFLLYRHVG